MMNIVFITDSLETFDIKKDSSYAMMCEAQRRGHRVFFVPEHGIHHEQGEVRLDAQELELIWHQGRVLDEPWFRVRGTRVLGADSVDAVMVRKDPPFDQEYLHLTHFLSLFEQEGVRIINSPRALRDHNEKLAILEYPKWIVPTLVSKNISHLRDFLGRYGQAIIKPLDGMGGSQIFKLQQDDDNLSVIFEVMTHLEQRHVMIQRYIPEIRNGDKRILIIDGFVAPYCLARLPSDGEVRGNLAAGGQGVVQKLSEHDLTIAQSIAPKLRQEGILLAGLDVIGDHLTEINITSPTGFQEIQQGSPYDPVSAMISVIERYGSSDQSGTSSP